MAGYLFGLDSDDSLAHCVESGIYSTKLGDPTGGIWAAHHEGTFADYCSMRPGDNVYFFIKRRIYGMGKLVCVGGDCKFLNYPNASLPTVFDYSEVRDLLLYDFGDQSSHQRFVCFFEPDPVFFKKGIDMDDVLSSDPQKFKILRVFWKLSFIKFGDEENQAFRDVVLQRNYDELQSLSTTNSYASNHMTKHADIELKQPTKSYALNVGPFLSTTAREDNSLRHEMALEAGLIFQLSESDRGTIEIFGRWDYLSHQVAASPFKPVDYMDKMDVFGYRYIPNHSPTVAKFLVAELKAGIVTKEDLLQLMKYVDWVKNEYSMGDYSMIEAFLVGFSFTDECVEELRETVERNFIHGFRPSTPMRWNHVRLVSYKYVRATEKLSFYVEADATVPINPKVH